MVFPSFTTDETYHKRQYFPRELHIQTVDLVSKTKYKYIQAV